MNANTTSVLLGCARCHCAPASRDDMVILHYRNLYEESHEGYALYRCSCCGQVYLEQFHEIIDWVGGEDDLWQRWMPLTGDELTEVDRLFPGETDDYDEVPRLTALMHRRGRLVKDPEGVYFWSEHGWDAGEMLPSG